MKTEQLEISGIPAVLYGEAKGSVFLFVHGKCGCKEEGAAFAEIACPAGYQVLAADLPEHGQRSDMQGGFDPWTAAPELRTILEYAKRSWDEISIRANSIGAYFSMLAFSEEDIRQALFVSPIVDMERLICNMMGWAGVTEAELMEKGEIITDFGETLSWPYLRWVREHPLDAWRCQTAILYAGKDNLTARATVEAFAARHNAQLTVFEDGEHWFHTPEQLERLTLWERESVEIVADVAALVAQLTSKDSAQGCRAMEQLIRESERSSCCYAYLDEIAELLRHRNSLVRNRAIALIAANVKWDSENKTGAVLDELLEHITDEKPITARKCIQALPRLAAAKPYLAERIALALKIADASCYKDSMRPLVEKDISTALCEIRAAIQEE